ncbi:MAG: hypothetical protein J6Y77_02905 [Paludibacteraceae bacterium]|nr:hypothetical protein [Paludibacteraceae bacterium]
MKLFWTTFLLAAVLLVPLVLLMGYRVFFTKNGRFPNTHVSGSAALRKKGIGCVQSQDREARREILQESEFKKQTNNQ